MVHCGIFVWCIVAFMRSVYSSCSDPANNPCSSNPCNALGTTQCNNHGGVRWTCTCKAGYTGQKCDTKLSKCALWKPKFDGKVQDCNIPSALAMEIAVLHEAIELHKMEFFFRNVIFLWLLFVTIVMPVFLYEAGPISWLFNQHCGYWWAGALTPKHQ